MQAITDQDILDAIFIQAKILEVLEEVHGYSRIDALYINDDLIEVLRYDNSAREYEVNHIPINQIVGHIDEIKSIYKQAQLMKDPEYRKYLELKKKFEKE